ncbi:hypothetical protein AM501_09905 [Aneurinibacillus migulanus]|uniref:hypothetical protein n=1 Tax=Aneurinibacillus migulanus TaxID=47500 RepID=UPI0005BD8722|nr:hypothetical protein [Aneurinibacillus migulanus]KIV56458.1 hypothetical protein TS64_09320 [Aneurinibacillus migulanus]KPD08466.1 hypothetical protein AM501_09905 [Aneurinibacillus migulanus]
MNIGRRATRYLLVINSLYILWGIYHVLPSIRDIYEAERYNGFIVRWSFMWLTLSGVFSILGNLIAAGMSKWSKRACFIICMISLLFPIVAIGMAAFTYGFPGGFYILLITCVTAIVWTKREDIQEVYTLLRERKQNSKREQS